MGSGVELQGVDQMLESIRRKMNSGIFRLENQGLREGGEIFAEGQREKVSVSSIDHLHMRDDINVSPVRREDGLRFVTIGPGNKTKWRAHFDEYGTKNHSARPFIYPSFHENKSRVSQFLSAEFRKGMQ
ncbi:HK97-gp10 family putative phage morphogenesis protein [Paenibacillus antarcticus]|uniref:HK97 gp10 family phage protein n=1 Tax=Paenibacillus antarcticus TaxID=253703 RepID=A0A168R176_9BACL|nr:HK97-gp10 family putative phage morphogenesis protein [Paenibacillus antarcticus]OAB48461.1 hypothetical protein PBAT_02180 [Paenibacillus antarcticus]